MALSLKSQRQIKAEILGRLISQLGLTDINSGSVTDVLVDSVAQQDFALYYQIAQVSRLVDIDKLSGIDLDNKAFEYGLTRNKAQKTKGLINVLRPDGFVKVSTTFYAGSKAPIQGDTVIDVNDASSLLIGTSGTLILGRGSNNEEEVAYAVAPTQMTTFWRYTLSSALSKNHAVEETVILKQGVDEIALAGTVVVVPASGVSEQIQFTLDNDTTVLAGELETDNVEVTAILTGTSGNIPVGYINGESAFPTPPFTGARAYNPVKFTTGQDLESDDSLRDRIKNYIQGITKAVKEAIKNAIVGLVDPETAKRVVSANIVLPVEVAGDVKVYIDDGTGFEPSFESVGFETVLDSSTGGEQRLQVTKFPIVKAQVESNISEPFDMSSGSLTLTYEVGTIQETITFQVAEFAVANAATAEEITALINDKATLIEARTAEVGTYILLTAKADTNENIQIIGGSANAILSFPTDRKETIQLYIDDVKKSKDGQTATLDCANSAPYNLTLLGSFPHVLNLIVDGKTNSQVASFGSSDAADPAAVTAAEVCAVINRDISGLVATPILQGTKIRLESLTLLDSDSKLRVTGGALNTALGFSTTQVAGTDGDYVFNRELGIIQLKTPLVANQSVTLGSQFTRGKLRAASPELYAPGNGTTLVISIDGGADQTITFDGTFVSGQTAAATAAFINGLLNGGTAVVREIGNQNYLEINTNTYTTNGSIQIKSSSTGNGAFNFTTNTVAVSGEPNKSFVVSSSTGPFSFAEKDSLVVVVDNDIVNNTFSISMNYPGAVTTATSTTVFRDSSLPSIFPNSSDLTGFKIAFTEGANTDTGVVTAVSIPVSGQARYSFDTNPTNFGIFAAGDLWNIQNLDDSENNGYFVILSIGADYVQVANANAIAASGQLGDGILSQRRTISAYNSSNGQITVSSAFNTSPSVGNDLIVIPSTVNNLVAYMNNTKITSLSLKAAIEGTQGNTKLQIASRSSGSDGYIQVTGGDANRSLNFPIIVNRGLQAYSYWTGLLELVHRTIYGDDSDLTSFPGFGAAGITFRVLAPTIFNVSVQLQLTLKTGVSITSVENQVKSAVSGYINTLGVGDDVIIEQIRAAVIAIPGITDVVILTPTSNIVIADNERADISDPNILIG